MEDFNLKWNMTINSRNVLSNYVIGFSGLSSLLCLAFEGGYAPENANGFLNDTEGRCTADGKEKHPDLSQVLPLPCHCEVI